MDEQEGQQLSLELSTAIVLFHEALGRELGLGAADHKALGVVRRHGPLTLGALAANLSVVPSAVAITVQRLQRAGHVERVPSADDRRRVLVRALPTDDTVESQAMARLENQTSAFMGGLTDDQRAAVLDYITLTIRVLNEETAHLGLRGDDRDAPAGEGAQG